LKMGKPFRLLVLADLHVASQSGYRASCPERKTHLSLELFQQVLFRYREDPPAAIVVLGDFLDQPSLPGAREDFQRIVSLLRETGWPAVIVQGNHDLPEEDFLAVAGDLAVEKEISGFLLYPFADRYLPDETCFRTEESLERFRKVCLEKPGRPVIALQHNVVYPCLEQNYPMNFNNSQEIISCYSQLSVQLSLSGHYHHGLPCQERAGVQYLCVPSLCEPPFSYLMVEIADRVQVKKETLVNTFPLPDVHCHTEFAYCATTVNARLAVEKSQLFQCRCLVLTEHSAQLYLSAEDFWQANFLKKPGLIRVSRERKQDRMEKFLSTVKPLRCEFTLLGLEVELDYEGKLTVLPEDRENFDLLVGAIHWLPEDSVSQGHRKLEKSFLSACEKLCVSGIQVLAHPFRIFRRYQLQAGKHLYSPLARILAETKVAAEINFHTNIPEPEFFQLCLEKGVKLATGTDAHCLEEVGDLSRHFQFLTEKLQIKDLDAVVFQPVRKILP